MANHYFSAGRARRERFDSTGTLANPFVNEQLDALRKSIEQLRVEVRDEGWIVCDYCNQKTRVKLSDQPSRACPNCGDGEQFRLYKGGEPIVIGGVTTSKLSMSERIALGLREPEQPDVSDAYPDGDE